jgi:hypothetical protein
MMPSHTHECDAHLAALCGACQCGVDAEAQAMKTMMVVVVGCFFATMVVAVNIGVVDWDVLISATEAIVNLTL